MKTVLKHLAAASSLAVSLGAVSVIGQIADTAEAHREAARAAAGQEHLPLFNTVCRAQTPGAGRGGRGGRGAAATDSGAATAATDAAAAATARGGAAPTGRGNAAARGAGANTAAGQTTAPAARRTPARETWHAEPVKVFDNLYFVGQTEYSAWAITTSDGIIVMDTIFDYSVEDEIAGGLRKLGLDPATIKYAIVSHGHGDHSGGAKYLQDTFGTRILLSAADWDLLDRSSGTKPRRDMVVTDGQKLTLGDTTLTLYLTPGHTPGTVSTIIPVKDNGRSHTLAYVGGTAFNFTITADKPRSYWFTTYSASAERFRDLAVSAGAEGVITNHTDYDGSATKQPLLAARKPGDPHPYLPGTESVRRYLTVASECAKAGLAAELSTQSAAAPAR